MYRLAFDRACIHAYTASDTYIFSDDRLLLQQWRQEPYRSQHPAVLCASLHIESTAAVFFKSLLNCKRAASIDDLKIRPRADPLLHAADIGRHQFRLQIDEMTEHRVECDRIGRCEYDSHRRRRSGLRSVALHRHDAVHYMKLRPHESVEIRKHFREDLRRRELRMRRPLVDAVNASERVFHSACYSLELVCLHLADVYDPVRLYHFIAEYEAVCRSALRESDLRAAFKLAERYAEAVSSCLDPAFLRDSFYADHRISRGIPVSQIFVSVFLQKRTDRFENRGVCRTGFFRLCLRQQIRLQDDTAVVFKRFLA